MFIRYKHCSIYFERHARRVTEYFITYFYYYVLFIQHYVRLRLQIVT